MQIIKENNLTRYDELVVPPKKEQSDPKYYRVYVGSFKLKSSAEGMEKKLKANGFSTELKQTAGEYTVQVGAYTYIENAKKKIEEVKSAGFVDVRLA